MGPFHNFVVTLRRLLADPSFRAASSLLVALLTVGTLFYWAVEGWSLLDSLYFSVIAAATVGFGDFAPQTDVGKAFTIVYVLVGVGLLVMILGRIASGMVNERLEREAESRSRRPRGHGRRKHADESRDDGADATTDRSDGANRNDGAGAGADAD